MFKSPRPSEGPQHLPESRHHSGGPHGPLSAAGSPAHRSRADTRVGGDGARLLMCNRHRHLSPAREERGQRGSGAGAAARPGPGAAVCGAGVWGPGGGPEPSGRGHTFARHGRLCRLPSLPRDSFFWPEVSWSQMAPTCLLCWVCSLLCVWSVVMGHPCSLDHQVGGPWGQRLGVGRDPPLLVLPAQLGCPRGSRAWQQLLLCAAQEKISDENPWELAELIGRCAVPVATSRRGGSPMPKAWLSCSQPWAEHVMLSSLFTRAWAGKALSDPWHF